MRVRVCVEMGREVIDAYVGAFGGGEGTSVAYVAHTSGDLTAKVQLFHVHQRIFHVPNAELCNIQAVVAATSEGRYGNQGSGGSHQREGGKMAVK